MSFSQFNAQLHPQLDCWLVCWDVCVVHETVKALAFLFQTAKFQFSLPKDIAINEFSFSVKLQLNLFHRGKHSPSVVNKVVGCPWFVISKERRRRKFSRFLQLFMNLVGLEKEKKSSELFSTEKLKKSNTMNLRFQLYFRWKYLQEKSWANNV